MSPPASEVSDRDRARIGIACAAFGYGLTMAIAVPVVLKALPGTGLVIATVLSWLGGRSMARTLSPSPLGGMMRALVAGGGIGFCNALATMYADPGLLDEGGAIRIPIGGFMAGALLALPYAPAMVWLHDLATRPTRTARGSAAEHVGRRTLWRATLGLILSASLLRLFVSLTGTPLALTRLFSASLLAVAVAASLLLRADRRDARLALAEPLPSQAEPDAVATYREDPRTLQGPSPEESSALARDGARTDLILLVCALAELAVSLAAA